MASIQISKTRDRWKELDGAGCGAEIAGIPRKKRAQDDSVWGARQVASAKLGDHLVMT
jgi:hypothetical protein